MDRTHKIDKLICVGKNYLDHARELGDAVPEKPVLFIKPPSVMIPVATLNSRVEAPLRMEAGQTHHECEIVVRVGRGGYRMNVAEAESAIEAVTLGLDMTLRDIQAQAKKNGHPWETSKVFPGSAIVGPWLRKADFKDYLTAPFSFSVDEAVRQQGQGTQMRLSPAECIAYASEFFPICEGDLIFTGTPAGVGPVAAGQIGKLSWANRLEFSVQWRSELER